MMKKLFLAAMFSLAAQGCFAERIDLKQYQVYVVDGDTIKLGKTSFRLMGYDTPETYRSKCEYEKALGYKAKERVRSLIDNAGSVYLETKGRPDKYGRILADLIVDGYDVGDILIHERLAVPYEGGRRINWC